MTGAAEELPGHCKAISGGAEGTEKGAGVVERFTVGELPAPLVCIL